MECNQTAQNNGLAGKNPGKKKSPPCRSKEGIFKMNSDCYWITTLNVFSAVAFVKRMK